MASQASRPTVYGCGCGTSSSAASRTSSSVDTPADDDLLPAPTAAKRARTEPSPLDETHLSPELWAHVMLYLPYSDILNCTLVNRMVLHEAAPKVTSLRICSARQMRAEPARRFSGARRIKIDCLFQDNYDQMVFSREAVGMAVPFLGCLPALQEASLGGTVMHVGQTFYLEYGDREGGRPLLENERLMRSMLLGICGAYRSGTVSAYAKIDGVLLGTGCSNTDRYDGRPDATWSECAQCVDVCKCFPLEQVASFKTTCIRYRRGIRDRYRCQVCLPMVRILELLLRRPGGRELLLKPTFFLEQVILHRRTDYFCALKVLDLLPLAKITSCDIQDHMAGGLYMAKERYVARYLFDEMVAAGIPLKRGYFEIVQEAPFSIRESVFDEMVAAGMLLKREDFVLVP